MRESRYRTSFSSTKFFLDCEEILDFSSRRIFWASGKSAVCYGAEVADRSVPLARSSSITRSESLADMDMYSADME